jgi:DNA-binding CsgD family transcriptional regulator
MFSRIPMNGTSPDEVMRPRADPAKKTTDRDGSAQRPAAIATVWMSLVDCTRGRENLFDSDGSTKTKHGGAIRGLRRHASHDSVWIQGCRKSGVPCPGERLKNVSGERMKGEGEIPEQLLDLIYDATMEESLWSDVLAGIADLTGSLNGAIFGQVIGASKVYFSHITRSSEECERAFRERHVQNPHSLYMDGQPAGALIASDEIISLSELKKTAFYDEVFRPQDVAHVAMIPLESRRGFTAAFNLCRSERQGPFEEREMATLKRLVPHMRRSTTLGFRLQGYRALRSGESEVLDRLSAGVILLDRSAKVILTNKAAELLSLDAGPLRLHKAGISAFHPSFSRRLDELVQSALRGVPAATMSIPHPDDGRLVTLFVSSVRSRDIDRFAGLDMRDAAAMIFVFDPAGSAEVPPMWLMDAYRLTLAEARVALQAALGRSVAEIGTKLNISPNTVKTHLRRVFFKIGVRGQAELAGLVASLRVFQGELAS